MRKLIDDVVYTTNYDGEVSYAYVRDYADRSSMLVYTFDRPKSLKGWFEEKTPTGIRFRSPLGTSVTFSELTLDSALAVFPNTRRTFTNIESLAAMAKKVINMADSYEVNTDPDETVSFTISIEGTVAAIIKTTKDGNLFTFVGGDWVEITEDDEAPTVFDLEVLDIEPEDIGAALDKWKESEDSGSDIPKEEMLPFAALTQ